MKEKIINRWDDILDFFKSCYGISNYDIDTWFNKISIDGVVNKIAYFKFNGSLLEDGVLIVRLEEYENILCEALRYVLKIDITKVFVLYSSLEDMDLSVFIRAITNMSESNEGKMNI